MPVTSYAPAAATDAELIAYSPPTFDDPKVYPTVSSKRIDAKYFLQPTENMLMKLRDIAIAGGGALKVRNNTGGTLAAGPVRVTGYDSSNNVYTIGLADADTNTPVDLLLLASLNNNTTGIAYIAGDFTSTLDTTAIAIGTEVFLSATAGVVTNTAPSGSDQIVQSLGFVKTQANPGVIKGFVRPPKKVGSSYLQAGIAGTITSTLSLEGVISPAALAANTNDWNPTGLSTANTIRVSASGAIDLTGITAPASAWQVILLHNVGANTITLKDESASSSAANRFALDADDGITADTSRTLQYDRTSSRWRVIGKGGGSISGTGTGGYVPRWTASTVLGDSVIQADAARVAINTAVDASYIMKVNGAVFFTGDVARFGNAVCFDTSTGLNPGGTVNDVAIGAGNFCARISPSAASTYTGIANPSNGRLLLITNANAPGGFTLTLTHQDTGSLAANRIDTGDGTSLILQGGDSTLLYYDATATRWRVISNNAGVAWDDRSNNFMQTQRYQSYVTWDTNSPSTITASQNDYNFGTTMWARISANASYQITGLANGVNGRVLILANVGSSPIELPHESTSSTGANRIITPSGATVTLSANYCAILIYDGATARWRLIAYYQVGGGGGTIAGSGTNGRVARFAPDATTITDSVIQDDGTNLGIGMAPNASYRVAISGALNVSSGIFGGNVVCFSATESLTPSGTNNDYGIGSGTLTSRISPTDAVTITGIAAPVAGRLLIIKNGNAVGGFTLTLTHDGAGSTAANRIYTPDGNSLTLQGGDTAILQYSSATSRWMVISTDAGVAWDDRANTFTANQTFPNTGLLIKDTGGDHTTTIKQNSDEAANRILRIPALGGDAAILTDVSAQNITGAKTFSNTSLQIYDTGGDHYITLAPSGNESANRTLSIPLLGAADTIVTLGTTQTLTGAKTFSNDNGVTFAGATANTDKIVIKPQTATATATFTGTITTANLTADRTFTFPDLGGTVQIEGPMFSVHRNGTTQSSLSASTYHKVRFTTEEYDTGGYYVNDADDSGGATESRFTPLVAGYYLVTLHVTWNSVNDGKTLLAAIYRNGALYREGWAHTGVANANQPHVVAIVYCNGTTDYIEGYAWHNDSSSRDISGSTSDTFMQAARITG